MMTNIHSEQQGDGPDIVLLHGWGFHSAVWQDILPLLTPHFRVTLIDIPGFGFSQPYTNDEYSLPIVAKDILAIAPSQACWLGWSMGGLIATYIAAHFPERVKALINVASTPSFLLREDWPGLELQILQDFSQMLAEDYAATIKRFLALQFLGCDAYRKQLAQLEKRLLERDMPAEVILAHGLALLEHTDLRAEFSALTMPLLNIQGRIDSLVPARAAPAIAALNTQCQVELINKASHAPFLSHPQEFSKLVVDFYG